MATRSKAWVCGHSHAAVRLLRLLVRILPGAWMSVSFEFCVLSGRGLCFELITRLDESYREASIMRWPWPTRGCCPLKYMRILFICTDKHSSGQYISVLFCDLQFVRFEFPIAVSLKIQFFWNVTPFVLESICWNFEEASCFHLKGLLWLLGPEGSSHDHLSKRVHLFTSRHGVKSKATLVLNTKVHFRIHINPLLVIF
jgi:hypothetical protein